MNIAKIAVIGAGIMGGGIAQVCAQKGFSTALYDIEGFIVDNAISKIAKALDRLIEKGKATKDEKDALLSRITPTSDLAIACRDAQFVIEAVPEQLELKRKIFEKAEKLSAEGAILASNTSQLSISALSFSVKNPQNVIGMHWFNPATIMKLIEIVVSPNTSENALKVTLELSKNLGKETIVCKDSEGFVTTRALSAFLTECFRIAEEGLASREEIDKAIKLAFNYPMGPFELADLIGLDTTAHASEGLTRAFGDRFRPPQSLVTLVNAGHLGVKTGKGFYKYPKS